MEAVSRHSDGIVSRELSLVAMLRNFKSSLTAPATTAGETLHGCFWRGASDVTRQKKFENEETSRAVLIAYEVFNFAIWFQD